MKTRYPLQDALRAAERWIESLSPFCERIQIAGSIRRQKPTIGDIEILYIPKRGDCCPAGELLPSWGDLAENELSRCLAHRIVSKREGLDGRTAWGKQIKLGIDAASGIPIDFFATTAPDWFSYLICRTGPKEHNVMLAQRAQSLGYRWEPYKGLATPDDFIRPESEEHFYELLQLPYVQPETRA